MIYQGYQKILEGISRVVFILLTVLVAAMVIIGAMQVFWRYVLAASLSWSEETLRYLNIWTIFLGISLGIPRGLHTAVEAIYSVLSPAGGKALGKIVQILSCGFALLMVLVGAEFALFNGAQLSPTMRLPMLYVYIAIPIGGALAFLFSLGELLKPGKEEAE